MRIAVLVHNGVVRDARVLKEAMALRDAGHVVEIHGISEGDERQELILPATDIPIRLVPRMKRLADRHPSIIERLTLVPGLVVAAALATLLILGLAKLFDPLGWPANAFALFLVNLVLLGGGWRKRHQIQRKFARAERSAKSLLKDFREKTKETLGRWRFGRRLHPDVYETVAGALVDSVLERPKPDVVHIHDHVALMAARRLKRRLGCPIVWDAHEIYEDLATSDPERGALNASIICDNQACVDGFVTINESIAAFYREKYKRLPTATILMNATRPAPKPTYDGRLHEAAGLPRHQKILLFQGGFAAKRGLLALVEAAGKLADDWSLVLMGWGNLEAELRARAAEVQRPGPSPAVVFLPGVPQEDLQAWTVGASLGAIAYENTGLNHLYCTPNKLWEYPNAGVPILCTDLVEMRRIVEANRIGFLLPRAFTADDIAGRVNALTEAELARARKACAAFIERDNWSVYAPRLVRLYADLECPGRVGDLSAVPA